MTSAPPKSIVFHWNTTDVDSIKWTSTRKLLLDLALLSKFLHNNYLLRLQTHSEVIPKKVGKHFSCRKHMSRDTQTNGNSLLLSNRVKCVSNYRASRLAHYQDRGSNDTCKMASIRSSRVSSASGGCQTRLNSDPTPKTLLTEDSSKVNNQQRITSDEVPTNMHNKVTQAPITSESRGDARRKPSGNEITLNVRSQSIGPTSNINSMAVLTSIRNRSNPDTSELTQLGTRADSATRNNPNSRACYFCWCCCCSCSCLNIKPKPEESLRTPISNEPQSKPDTMTTDERFTLEEAQKWAQNFELLMQSSAGRKVFQEFLKLEYSEENIMFFKAVEELQTETNVALIEEKARFIYEDYISILSPKEVSLDSRVRDLINSDMMEPSAHTFDEAQLQIFTLMQRDSYPRFINSRLYKDLLRQLGGSSTTSNSQTLFESRPLNNG